MIKQYNENSQPYKELCEFIAQTMKDKGSIIRLSSKLCILFDKITHVVTHSSAVKAISVFGKLLSLGQPFLLIILIILIIALAALCKILKSNADSKLEEKTSTSSKEPQPLLFYHDKQSSVIIFQNGGMLKRTFYKMMVILIENSHDADKNGYETQTVSYKNLANILHTTEEVVHKNMCLLRKKLVKYANLEQSADLDSNIYIESIGKAGCRTTNNMVELACKPRF